MKKLLMLLTLPLISLRATEAIEIPALTTLDAAGLVNVFKIVQFRDLIERFLAHPYKTKPKECTLVELVTLEHQGHLNSDLQKRIFDMITGKFLQIAGPYFNDIRHLKPVLQKLITHWAQQRDKADTPILLWASIEPYKEEQFIREFTPTLSTFYTFLVDIDILLQDVITNCPKSYAYYLECKKLAEEKHQHHE